MLKKLAYISIGIAIIALKKVASRLKPDQAEVEAAAAQGSATAGTVVTEPVSQPEITRSQAPPPSGADDLTAIDGIGPTYARRLQAAGITSYAQLANRTANDLRDIAQVKGLAADIDSWIAQAAVLAGR